MKNLIFTFLLVFCSLQLFAQDTSWSFSGQVQIRSEVDGRDFNNSTYSPVMSTMRSRVGVAKKIEDKAEFFVQIQDSRILGQEGSPSTYKPNLDAYQAYVKVNKLFNSDASLQAGRFMAAYGNERLIGASAWSYTSRAFDGARISVPLRGKLDIFFLTLNDARTYISNADPSKYAVTPVYDKAQSMYGFWYNTNLGKGIDADFYAYYDLNRNESNGVDADIAILTAGLNVTGSLGVYGYTVEGAIQTGKRGAKDASGYLAAASGYFKAGDAKLTLGVDALSGTDPDDQKTKDNGFYTTYGNNHRFYGFMDYFISIPSNTGNLGLLDAYLNTDYTSKPTNLTLSLAVHSFMSWYKPTGGDSKSFGQELDITAKYELLKGITTTWGGSYFFQGDLMKAIFNTNTTSKTARTDNSYWTYLMLTANF
ncbi:MAG: alginate export family protein [Ignavibacteria bacterium]|nr:alginate export family protein [Ignavibacteria bacterium]